MVPVTQAVNAQIKVDKQLVLVPQGISFSIQSWYDRCIISFYIYRFGVCCVFLISESGKSVNENCTYIRNPGFPNGYATTSEVSHTIQKCSPGE